MKRIKIYTVYILTNKYNTVLYIGVTGNLAARLDQHKNKATPGFTARYNLNKLVYYETTEDPTSAITREKQLKGWSRKKKQELITSFNPKWKDLTDSIL